MEVYRRDEMDRHRNAFISHKAQMVRTISFITEDCIFLAIYVSRRVTLGTLSHFKRDVNVTKNKNKQTRTQKFLTVSEISFRNMKMPFKAKQLIFGDITIKKINLASQCRWRCRLGDKKSVANSPSNWFGKIHNYLNWLIYRSIIIIWFFIRSIHRTEKKSDALAINQFYKELININWLYQVPGNTILYGLKEVCFIRHYGQLA